tara:strand:- start:1287 stop:1427 length:141 start_codon:yes stop_codon:yes gene_type:complete
MPIEKMRFEELNPPAEVPKPAKKKAATKVEAPVTPSASTTPTTKPE